MAASVAFRLDTVNRLTALETEITWTAAVADYNLDSRAKILHQETLILQDWNKDLAARIDSIVYQFHQDMRWRDAKLNNSWEWIQRHERENRTEAKNSNP
jgi:hypothetical protein